MTTRPQPRYARHDAIREERADGTVLLHAAAPLGPCARTSGDWLRRWAQDAPDRVFLAERSGAGWREVTYADAFGQIRALGGALLAFGLGPDRPLLVMSGNGVDHGLMSLAAQYAGIPVVPVAEQYSLIPQAHGRLVDAIRLVRPGMAFVSDADQFASALALDALDGVTRVATRPGGTGATPLSDLLKGDGAEADIAHARVTPKTVAKILMTSGSTSSPKGVLTTHQMMCTNQAQLIAGMPFLTDRPPRIVDWLPWNHVFGGSHNFNMMLANGGALYIDDGKPLKGHFDRTLENLRLITGTAMFNVPVGYQMLVAALREDTALRHRVFADLDMIFYAGASLPPELWSALEDMAREVRGSVPLMTSSWGLTETAPAVLLQQEQGSVSGRIGVPLPGSTVKLVPQDDGRFDVRVKGPNVMPGYFEAPEKTTEAFDAEGYFLTGDAMSFVDPDNVNLGLRFEGRISDDFKLVTGTWVRATALRALALEHLAPLAADLVVTGHDRNEIGLLIVPNRDAIAGAGYSDTAQEGAMRCPRLAADIATRLSALGGTGSSIRIARALVLADPPSLATGEITAKGNLNNRKLLATRARLVDRLYDDTDPATILPMETQP